MAGAQHVSTICLTYCLLSKGLWHSRIWIGSRSAGQVRSSPLLCAGTMAARLRLGSAAAAQAQHQPCGRGTFCAGNAPAEPACVTGGQGEPPGVSTHKSSATTLLLLPFHTVGSKEFCSVLCLTPQVRRSPANSNSPIILSNR